MKVCFGLDTFGDIPYDNHKKSATDAEAIRHVVKEAILADELGIDVIAIGEHHRSEFAISSPEMVLAAIASVTKKIKLSSGVTVLSSDDPVRVYERFATLDAVSNGRAEIILGRGSFTESFPLFGYDLRDYEVLFEEKVALFAELLKEKPVTWSGTTRAALQDADVFPKTEAGSIPTWIGVGGSPQSVIRAARYGFPVMFAIIGGNPERFRAYVDLYHQAAKEFDTTPGLLGMHSHGFIAETDEEAIKIAWPNQKKYMDKIGKERGWSPMTREQFDYERERGSLYIGSPETVAKKIARSIQTLNVDRFDLIYGGTLSAEQRLRMVQLYGDLVIPRVKEILSA